MRSSFKFFVPIAMLYTAVALADLVLVYRMTTLGNLTITAGIYVMPLYYLLEDMMAELYGYERTRLVIWCVQLSALVFSLIITIADRLPTPASWQHATAYQTVFGHVFRTIAGGGLVAMIGGAFINGYCLSKWKILTRGKYFLIRSLGSSSIGQFFQTSAGCMLLYFGILPFQNIIQMIAPLYVIQLICCGLISIPGSILVFFLKKIEGGDIYDFSTNFNPFKLTVTNQDIQKTEVLNNLTAS